jgi:hypothetical protein
MKKQIIFFLIQFFLTEIVIGQVIYPQVISCFGGYSATKDLMVTFTAGEPMFETIHNPNSILTQGFNQVYFIASDVKEIKEDAFKISFFPNPTPNILNLKFTTDKMNGWKLQVLDLQGKVLLQKEIKTTVEQIDLGQFANEIYIIQIFDKYKILKTIKVQKINQN